jgi:hypothetical protein
MFRCVAAVFELDGAVALVRTGHWPHPRHNPLCHNNQQAMYAIQTKSRGDQRNIDFRRTQSGEGYQNLAKGILLAQPSKTQARFRSLAACSASA